MSTATTEKAATETVVAIDPRQVQIGANVRLDANVDKEFVANVREEGVIVPVVGYFDGDGRYVVVDGQRRTLAAIEAKQATIPAFATRRREDADRIVAQMSANHHRVAITAAERAKGFEQLAGFGLSAAQIVKKTGYKRPEVDAGLKVAGSDLASKATERWGFLTLEQAAALAEFDQDADALQALTVAAERGSGFDHELQRQRDKREDREAIKTFAEQLTADGVTVIERPPHDHKTILRLNHLDDAVGNRITPETHADCPGHAAYVTREWRWIETDADDDEDATDEQEQVTVATYVCTDARAHGHVDRWAGGYGGSAKKKAADMSEPEREAARAERRDVIESNKAWKSAEIVRAAFVVKFLTRKTAPKGSAAFVVATIAEEGHWLSDHRTPTKADELLNGGKARMRADRAKAAENVTEGRALMLAVGQCCAAYEAQMGTHTWRNVTPGPARYLAFLAANGYELADVEKRAARLDKPASKSRAKKARKAATPPPQTKAPEGNTAASSDEHPAA